MLHVKIITPEKAVFEDDVESLTCQTVDGDVTILPQHIPLLTLLKDGVITIRRKTGEEYFSAGSGYIETNGKIVRILISHAVGQDELDEKKIKEVEESAQKLLSEKHEKADREKAFGMLRRATFDLKIINKRRKR
ncbi:MAG: ATP synthase F1 subunit epsilon [Patescibacteria group bacterium]|jgi:F-type H+-transporting ATPase subunit epsilon